MVLLRHGRERDSQGIIIVTCLDTGKTLYEGYVRQCIHCQYTWEYKPGSGIERGFCTNCDGHTCGRVACDSCYHKEKRIEDMEALERMNRAAIEAAVRQQELRELIAAEHGQRRLPPGRV